MSWSLSANKVPADKVVETIETFTLPESYQADAAYSEMRAQVESAQAAAKHLFLSGAVGTVGEFNIYLNGHAEPNHQKRPGYSQSAVTVSLQQWYDYSNG